MAFVELDRTFIALNLKQAYRPEEFDALRHFGTGLLKWPDLLDAQRIILLAGAASGKSEEFRQRATAIRRDGGFAIYLTVERLEAAGLDGSLNVSDREALAAWRRGTEPGWFLLDSIDEARINHKDVELALNRFAADLGEAYDRARVLLSCRGAAWAGDADMALVANALPVRERALREDREPVDPEEALLAKRDNASHATDEPDARDPVRLVALAPIDKVQRAAFLTAERATDVPAFEEALFNHGLDTLAERPGDLRTLARYWSRHERFGTLTEMIEFSIAEHLKETNDKRRSTIMISDEQARQGAERLAAAMTLGRSMELVLPNAEGVDARSIDPHLVLEDWTPNDVDGLLQRGLFAPATFGRVRFFHRSAQEYLTACWFNRLRPGLTDAELHRIFLADSFGVKTIPPALRAAAAWIAGNHAGLRAHVLDREPLVALTEGDPKRLPIADRRALLLAFARAQAAGDVYYRSIDHRSLWMFADEELAPAILEALALNRRPEFRFEMLRLIEQGGIRGCLDFVRVSALKEDVSPYRRIVATRVLAQLGDEDGLAAVARDLLDAPGELSPNLSPSLTVELFPKHLSVDQLLMVISRTKPVRRFQLEGFRDELAELYAACPDRDRLRLLGGLADLAFAEPLGDWPRLSKRHATLIAKCGPLARAAILDSDGCGISDELVRLLRAVGRARDEDREEVPSLRDLVEARPALKRALFRAELAAERAKREEPVRHIHRVGSGGDLLWNIGKEDRPWLVESLEAAEEDERLVALDALTRLSVWSDERESELDALAALVWDAPDLAAALADARAQMVRTAAEIALEEKRDGYARRRAEEEEARRKRLLDLRQRLQADPAALRDPARLAVWPGALPLLELTRWLAGHAGSGHSGAAVGWERLTLAFGEDVARSYSAGMKVLWRVTPPKRPVHRGGLRHVKWTTILSAAGLALEAAEAAHWAVALDPDEALLAARHVCLDDQTIPDWLGALMEAHPAITAPLVAAEIEREWRRGGEYAPFLERAAHGLPLLEPLRSRLVAMLEGPPPGHASRISSAADLVLRLDLDVQERDTLARIARRRLLRARRADDWQEALAHLRLLFRLHPPQAVEQLFGMLAAERPKRKRSRASELLRALFDRHRGSVVEPSILGPETLGRLTATAYGLKPRPRDDDDAVDFHDPRDALLSALISLDGEDAYRATLALAADPVVGTSGHRLRELAREIAERSADRPPWTEHAVRRFEADRLAPVATGADLLELTCALVDELSWGFRKADMSARAVIESARDEAAVQQWLGSSLQAMGGGRLLCHQEARVAGAKRPDITVTATSAPVEVAIEVKHGEKGWTIPELRHALRIQLAEQYLQPGNRRHGILVITNHRAAKFWRDPDGKRKVGFDAVIAALSGEAATILANSSGAITVAVRGIDAALTPPTSGSDPRPGRETGAAASVREPPSGPGTAPGPSGPGADIPRTARRRPAPASKA